MIARKIIYLDSTNATTVDLATGSAKWEYPQPIEPFGQSVKIAVHSFSYTNFFINVTAPDNVIYYSDDPAVPQKYTITIPNGSYGLSDLNDYITQTILAQTGLSIWSLSPNFSTGVVSVVFANIVGWYVNFTANAPPIIGFGVQHVPDTNNNTAFYSEAAPAQASFNNITQIKITSNIAQDSIDNSNLSSNTIHVSTPSAAVGSVQNDAPHVPLTIDSMLLTTKCSAIEVKLVDQLNRAVVLSEHFQLTILVL